MAPHIESKKDALEFIGNALYELGAHGPGGGMGVIEGLSVAVAGQGLKHPVGEELNNIAMAIDRLASVLEEGFRQQK